MEALARVMSTLLSCLYRRDFRLLMLGPEGKPVPQPVLWFGEVLEPMVSLFDAAIAMHSLCTNLSV